MQILYNQERSDAWNILRKNLSQEYEQNFEKFRKSVEIKFYELFKEGMITFKYNSFKAIDFNADLRISEKLSEIFNDSGEAVLEKYYQIILPLYLELKNFSKLSGQLQEKIRTLFLKKMEKYKKIFREDQRGVFYQKLPDNLSKSLFKNESLKFFYKFKLGPDCFEALSKVPSARPVSECFTMFNSIFNEGDMPGFDIYADNQKFMNKIVSIMRQNYNKMIINNWDVSKLEEQLINDVQLYYLDMDVYLQDVQSRHLKLEMNQSNKLLFLDLEAFRDKTIFVLRYFENYDVLKKFTKKMKENKKLYFSEEIGFYVENLKGRLFNFIDNDEFTKAVQIGEFNDKLKDLCYEKLVDGKICEWSVDAMDFLDLRDLSRNRYIYELLIIEFKNKFSKLDLSNTIRTSQVQLGIDTFIKFKDFVLDFINREMKHFPNIEENKLKDILVAALFAQRVNEVRWANIRDILKQYLSNMNENLKEFKEHGQKFKFFLKNLVEQLLLISNKNQDKDLSDLDIIDSIGGLDETQIQQIKAEIKYLVRHYKSWPQEMKDLMHKCEMESTDVLDLFNSYKEKYQTDFMVENPFLISSRCGEDYIQSGNKNCYAKCPENFREFNLSNCKKPEIYPANPKPEEKACLTNFEYFSGLCIPRCPLGWKDSGNWCERPIKLKKEIYLVFEEQSSDIE